MFVYNDTNLQFFRDVISEFDCITICSKDGKFFRCNQNSRYLGFGTEF